VFNAFAQVDSTTTRLHSGTGLGLAICRELITKMNGRIWLDSEPGRGSTFYCTAWFEEASIEEAAALKSPPHERQPARSISTASVARSVLVVEDTPANQKVMRAVLEKRGHKVRVANNGREGVELVQQERFDVVLMDVQMPMMDGLEATRIIRRLPSHELPRIPIIAMTAHVRREDRDKCLAAGMDDYIGKPIDANEVIRLVETLTPRARPELEEAVPACGLHVKDATHAQVQNEPLIDLAATLRRMGGDKSLVADMARFYLDDSTRLLHEIEAGLNRGDAESTHRAAHSLKGLSSNFDAELVVATAQQLEDLARAGNLRDALSILNRLSRDVEQVRLQLQASLDLSALP
jgi:CheY-like chemotaxis protein